MAMAFYIPLIYVGLVATFSQRLAAIIVRWLFPIRKDSATWYDLAAVAVQFLLFFIVAAVTAWIASPLIAPVFEQLGIKH